MTGYWSTPIYTGDADVSDPAHKVGLLLAEDDSLKWYLSGLTVPNRSGDSEVPVWFRYPEGERREKFPFITIDFLNIRPSYERWTSIFAVAPDEAEFCVPSGALDHKGLYTPSVAPTMVTTKTDTQGFSVEPYLMHQLLYQITVHSRSAQHDRILTSRFMTDILPPRPFWIPVDADNTYRRAELVNVQPNDTLETTEDGSKRHFRKSFTITMDAELLQSQIEAIEKARIVHIDLYKSSDRTTPQEPVEHLSTSTHTVGEPITISS